MHKSKNKMGLKMGNGRWTMEMAWERDGDAAVVGRGPCLPLPLSPEPSRQTSRHRVQAGGLLVACWTWAACSVALREKCGCG
jgi:hypothetical protein